MNRTLDLLWLKIRQYFKHPAESIRQADPIKPGRLYENYGYICKAVPYTGEEKKLVDADNNAYGIQLDADMLLERVRGVGIRNKDAINQLQSDVAEASSTPVSCQLCDFARLGVPCPLYNRLADGSTVCDTHRYIILKRPVK